MTAISIFDVDRTITRRPTYSLFLLYAMRRTAPWRIMLIPLLIPVALAYAAKAIPRERMKEAMHHAALGRRLPRARAEALASAFADDLIKQGIFPQAFALMNAERAAGRRLMLATAAPQLYIAPLAERLGIADVVATAGTWQDDWLLTAITGRNCYGAAKLAMIEAAMAERGIDRQSAHVRFYTDHASDQPVCEWANEAVAVNPSPKMRALAETKGWPIIDWRVR